MHVIVYLENIPSTVAVSCGYDTCFAVRTCDGLYHFIFSIDRVGIPFGIQPIIWTHCKQVPDFQFLPTGQHGLCFGCCFLGPLSLRFLINGPPIGVRFRESLVIRLQSEIDQIHLGIEA